MDAKPPVEVDLLAPLWVWAISLLGGFTAYLEDFNAEDTWSIRIRKVAARISSSALAGVLTYNALLGLGLVGVEGRMGLWVVAVGISGHMGPEALKVMADVFRKKANAV